MYTRRRDKVHMNKTRLAPKPSLSVGIGCVRIDVGGVRNTGR